MRKKEVYKRNVEILKFIIVLLVFLSILIIIYYFFLYTKTCQDQECFTESLVRCKRARWTNDAEEATWLYTINGKSGKNCGIEVKLLVIKKGKIDIGKTEGKSMTCYLPLSIASSPEQDLGKCTGPLKEDLQDLIINRMHSYVLENLGEISEELIKPL